MQHSKIRFASAVFFVSILFLGVFYALALDSDFGRIDVQTISINDGNIELSGLLYRPKPAVADNPAAAVVLVHGICGSKEMMSSIGLELARRGMVSLCLDLFGHGKSQGTLEEGQREPSFGVYSAVQYLKAQPFVNSSAVGLIGHSLGAGAVRAAIAQDNQIGAVVLVSGGLGEIVEGSKYGVFNSTFPRDLLVIVGKYDVLFDIEELAEKELPIVFGTQLRVVPGVLYGDFSVQTARKFVVPYSTHLLELLDSVVVSESVEWMENAFGKPGGSNYNIATGFVYSLRELCIGAALVGVLGITFLAVFPFEKLVRVRFQESLPEIKRTPVIKLRLYVVWAIVNLSLFIPMFGVGSVVGFPPLVFGSSAAWWMFGSGLLTLLVLTRFSEKILGERVNLKEKLITGFSKRGVFLAFALFLFLFAATTTLAVVFGFEFRIISPILRDVSSASRALLFFAFIPFFFPYFMSEGLCLHSLAMNSSSKGGNWSSLQEYAVTLFAKISPFLILLFVQLSVKIVFDIWVLPSFIGFLLEFLWLIVPIFAIAVSFSWWLYRRTGNLIYGTVFNTLLMSWIAAVVFPF